MRGLVRQAIPIGVILCMMISCGPCLGDPAAPITVENRTNQTLYIFIEDHPFGEVKPGDVLDAGYGLLWQEEYRVEAMDSSGQLVVSGIVPIHDISGNLRKKDWRIVITSNGVIVPEM